MKDQSLPKPNTQALSWFFAENKQGALTLKPKYQRNPIWSIGQKCFLIDSIISGCPIPQIFINIKTKIVSGKRQTEYEVVDGQQRLRAILEFMNDEYKLVRTTAKSYPVSKIYSSHIGKSYSELPEKLQESIWNYFIAVQELRGWSDSEIRALFRRLNYVVERLNKQELRHSQYFGEFVETVEALAKHAFWDSIELFSRSDSQRMKDVEFISELLVLLMHGPQEGQKTLDQYYAGYDVSFPKKATHIAKFNQVLLSLETIKSYLVESRYKKKADFYGLFAAVANLNQSKKPEQLKKYEKNLRTLEKDLLKKPAEMTARAAKYHSTVVEGGNKRAKREQRIELLEKLLS